MGRWRDASGYDPNITHPFPMMAATANGPVVRDTIVTEIQVISYNSTPLTQWIQEETVLLPYTGTEIRLSGAGVRRVLYFSTTPRDSNLFLYVSRTKTGLTSRLPGSR